MISFPVYLGVRRLTLSMWPSHFAAFRWRYSAMVNPALPAARRSTALRRRYSARSAGVFVVGRPRLRVRAFVNAAEMPVSADAAFIGNTGSPTWAAAGSMRSGNFGALSGGELFLSLAMVAPPHVCPHSALPQVLQVGGPLFLPIPHHIQKMSAAYTLIRQRTHYFFCSITLASSPGNAALGA